MKIGWFPNTESPSGKLSAGYPRVMGPGTEQGSGKGSGPGAATIAIVLPRQTSTKPIHINALVNLPERIFLGSGYASPCFAIASPPQNFLPEEKCAPSESTFASLRYFYYISFSVNIINIRTFHLHTLIDNSSR